VTAGGYAYVSDTTTSVIAHELGHNFGLLHSGTQECQNVVENDPRVCDVQEYGDLYDVMGASWTQVGSLNAAQSARLGLLPGTAVQRVDVLPSGSATVVLAPLGGSTGTRAVQVVDQMTSTTYYLEYRAAVGQDATILGLPQSASEPNLTAGVLLRRVEHDSGADSSILLDGTPSSGVSWYRDVDPTLALNQTVHVPGADVDLTLTAQDASSATVHIVKNTSIDIQHASAGGDGGWEGAATTAIACGTGGCSPAVSPATVYS